MPLQTRVRTTLIVTFQHEGWHAWPEAPEARGYLAARHRHLFHFRCELYFKEYEDRDVEFHDFLARCKSYLGSKDDFGSSSCETIAKAMASRMSEEYSLPAAVECWEDGECGARVEVSHDGK